MDKVTILVVEDDWIIAQDIKTSLEKQGYAVPAIVTTGEEVVQKTIEVQPDLVLIDINLFGENKSLGIAQSIHKICNVPIVFLTTASGKGTIEDQLADIVIIKDATGKVIGASHIVKGGAFDITERKQAELEIQRSKDLKEAIFNDSADAIFLVDCETLLTFDCNHRAVQLFEAHSKDELIGIAGHTLQRQQFTPQELVAIAQEINTTGVWSREVEYVTKQGNSFWGNLAVKQINVASRTINLVRVTDITKQKQAQEQIKASLKEKEVLLKEIHHRVKNNLQIVKSLLQLQARRTQDREAILVLQDSQNRITSIALVHEKLYRSDDLAKIDFAQYIPDLTAHLFDSYKVSSTQVVLKLEIDNIVIEIDTAIPCGLIINELVSNSLKYAFPDPKKGEVEVKVQDNNDGTMTLIVQDNGIGIPEEFNIATTQSLGLTLVQGLVEQLEGSLELDRSRGTSFRITIPHRETGL
ncbi:MAG TPA: histidine kinase dimerization/phosphoacceptor domain -containing protein [Cyanophyceae cyanobacterium]